VSDGQESGRAEWERSYATDREVVAALAAVFDRWIEDPVI
jgi:hypothetical protein